MNYLKLFVIIFGSILLVSAGLTWLITQPPSKSAHHTTCTDDTTAFYRGDIPYEEVCASRDVMHKEAQEQLAKQQALYKKWCSEQLPTTMSFEEYQKCNE